MVEIIVIGGNHHNTLSVLRSLGDYAKSFGQSDLLHINLICISDSPKPYVKYSRYIHHFEKVEKEEELPDVLLSKYKSDKKPIIIACSDAIAACLDINRELLSDHFIMPGASTQGRLTELMDKGAMARCAAESGLTIPYSVEVSVSDLSDTAIENLMYPCITKPLVSKDGSKDDIHILKNADDFKRTLALFKSDAIQIQQFIDKEFEYQLIGCSLRGGEQVIIPGASQILRQPANTNTGFLKYIPKFDFDVTSCQQFLKKANFSGLFSMEFLRGKDGKDYFMETNFRNDGNAICVTAAGMNLPRIWVEYNLRHDVESYINSCQMKEVLVMPEFNDFKNVLNRKLSILQWLKDVRRTDCFMEYDSQDSKPFWMYLVNKIKSPFLKILKL